MSSRTRRAAVGCAALLLAALFLRGPLTGFAQSSVQLPNPILFVTQVPNAATFATIGATFGDQLAGIGEAPRGGGLWVRYPDGTLKNLTAAAGYGSKAADGFQDASAIAVRDPSGSW